MNKFLKVLCVFLVIGVITVLCYFFGTPTGKIEMPIGQYYLDKTTVVEDDKVVEEIDYTVNDKFIETYKNRKIKGFSGDIGMIEDGKLYDYEVKGTNISIRFDGEETYTGIFAEELIMIEIYETTEGDKEVIYQYYYMLKEV